MVFFLNNTSGKNIKHHNGKGESLKNKLNLIKIGMNKFTFSIMHIPH